MAKFGVVGPDRAAVRAEDGRIFIAWDVIERLIEVASDPVPSLLLNLTYSGWESLSLAIKESFVWLMRSSFPREGR